MVLPSTLIVRKLTVPLTSTSTTERLAVLLHNVPALWKPAVFLPSTSTVKRCAVPLPSASTVEMLPGLLWEGLSVPVFMGH